MVPLATNRPAALPKRWATVSSSARTVGSPSRPSSPSGAQAMASSICGVGRVTVSLRRSTASW